MFAPWFPFEFPVLILWSFAAGCPGWRLLSAADTAETSVLASRRPVKCILNSAIDIATQAIKKT